jgi:hypothetical protein
VVENTRNTLAIEAMAAAQAIDFLAPLKDFKAVAAGARGDPGGVRDHGEGSRDVPGFRAHRGVDCQREGGRSAAIENLLTSPAKVA